MIFNAIYNDYFDTFINGVTTSNRAEVKDSIREIRLADKGKVGSITGI